MKSSTNIQTTGTITQQHGGNYYHVKLDNNGQEILCYTVNRFRVTDWKGRKKKRPRIFVGDKVKVEISPQNFDKGMLVGFVNK